MPRKIINQKSNIDTLVSQYGEHNADFNSLKKIVETEKLELKSLMESENMTEYVGDDYTVTYSVSKKEKFNEDKMLDILKRDWANRYGSLSCPYIKTKEYIDMDILESVMYANELPKETMVELDSCIETTEMVTLRCKKTKKAKEE